MPPEAAGLTISRSSASPGAFCCRRRRRSSGLELRKGVASRCLLLKLSGACARRCSRTRAAGDMPIRDAGVVPIRDAGVVPIRDAGVVPIRGRRGRAKARGRRGGTEAAAAKRRDRDGGRRLAS